MKPSDIKFRASSVGYIMTEPKEKSPYDQWNDTKAALGEAKAAYEKMNKETVTAKKKKASIDKMEAKMPDLEAHKDDVHLSETCKGHLADIMVRAKYNRQTDTVNKYTTKGLMVEEDSITLYNRLNRGKFFRKNEEQKTNHYISGTPDLYEGESIDKATIVHDVKSSWDIFTFFRNHEGGLNKQYFWQMQAYMALTGAKRSFLAYCLINTPDALIEDEKRRLFYKMNVVSEDNADYVAACEALELNMRYDDIPIEERCIVISIERDEEAIDRMYERVDQCRRYMVNKYPSLFQTQILQIHDKDCVIIDKA